MIKIKNFKIFILVKFIDQYRNKKYNSISFITVFQEEAHKNLLILH